MLSPIDTRILSARPDYLLPRDARERIAAAGLAKRRSARMARRIEALRRLFARRFGVSSRAGCP